MDGRIDAEHERDAEPDDERDAGEDEGRQRGPRDAVAHLLPGVDRVAEVAVEHAVGGAAQGLGQEVREARGADERGRGGQRAEEGALGLRVAEAHPAAVLDRDRLVEAPGLLELSRCSSVMRGLLANFAVGPPGAASRIPYTTIVIPNSTGIAWSARRSTNLIIGVRPQPEYRWWVLQEYRPGRLTGCAEGTPAGAARARLAGGRAAGSDGASGVSGRPVDRYRFRCRAGGLLPDEPVLAVPGRSRPGCRWQSSCRRAGWRARRSCGSTAGSRRSSRRRPSGTSAMASRISAKSTLFLTSSSALSMSGSLTWASLAPSGRNWLLW